MIRTQWVISNLTGVSVNGGKGSYILLLEVTRDRTIAVGRLKNIHFRRGYYAYVGSAMNGFKARLNRHLGNSKKPWWHIDYLLQEAALNNIITYESDYRAECAIARAISRRFAAIPGFGSSDCSCHSHLFFAPNEMKPAILADLYSINLEPSSNRASSGEGRL